jgi:hypothetical protein
MHSAVLQGKVRFLGAETTPSVFATNVGITATDHEVTVAFFEAILPIGPEATTTAKEIPGRCVARIVVSASRFDEIAGLFTAIAAQRRSAPIDASATATQPSTVKDE